MIGIIGLILMVVFSVPMILIIAGLAIRKKNPNASKVLLILGISYSIIVFTVITIGIGICSGGLR